MARCLRCPRGERRGRLCRRAEAQGSVRCAAPRLGAPTHQGDSRQVLAMQEVVGSSPIIRFVSLGKALETRRFCSTSSWFTAVFSQASSQLRPLHASGALRRAITCRQDLEVRRGSARSAECLSPPEGAAGSGTSPDGECLPGYAFFRRRSNWLRQLERDVV